MLRIYVQGDPWYNVEPGPNLIPVGVTCHDLETVIRKTLTVRVNNSVSIVNKEHLTLLRLTLYVLMDSPFSFDIINLGWSIV